MVALVVASQVSYSITMSFAQFARWPPLYVATGPLTSAERGRRLAEANGYPRLSTQDGSHRRVSNDLSPQSGRDERNERVFSRARSANAKNLLVCGCGVRNNPNPIPAANAQARTR
jgi:hypothetical protein